MQTQSAAHVIESRSTSATDLLLFRIRALVILLFGGLLVLSPTSRADETMRSWENSDGSYSFRAALVGKYGNLVDLRREDGVTLRIPVELLSKKDRDVVASPNQRYFEIKGVGRISSPEGYNWTLMKQAKVAEEDFSVYACQHPDLAGGMTLTLSPQIAGTDAVRTSHLKGHWNGLLESVTSLGLSIEAVTRPELTGTIPDRVEYHIKASDLNGTPTLVRGVTLFAKDRTFLFVIFEVGDSEKANQFYEISKSLTITD